MNKQSRDASGRFCKINDFVYVLKFTDENFRAKNDFQYPTSGMVECPDWKNTQNCGNGLHGFLYGEGDLSTTDFREKVFAEKVA
jgi:hypothetical protein